MLNRVPKNLKQEVETTLALVEEIRTVDPPLDLTGRIMARLHEASQPGYYPIKDSQEGEKLDDEELELAHPQLFPADFSRDRRLGRLSCN